MTQRTVYTRGFFVTEAMLTDAAQLRAFQQSAHESTAAMAEAAGWTITGETTYVIPPLDRELLAEGIEPDDPSLPKVLHVELPVEREDDLPLGLA